MDTQAKVLFVESAAILREPIEAALVGAGIEVVSVTTGQAAVSLLASEAPGVLVIDLDLPGGQAWLALAHARSLAGWQRAPVIVLSSVSDKATVIRAAKFRVDGFIVKSKFNLPAFVERVRAALAGGAETAAAPRAAVEGAADGDGPPAEQAAALPGDHAEGLKSIKPILTRTEISECVDRCDQLRAFSPTVAMLLKVSSSQDCSMERVVKAASHDHAITLKILKLANSVAYGRGDPVDSLKSAVMRIGLDKIRQAVMNIGLIEQFEGGHMAVNLPHFWEHAIGCAVVAGQLAQATGAMDPESAFTAGLLHDVGRVVLMEQLGERYAGVVEKARAMHLPLEQVESRMLLVNHADVMDRLLHAWKFSRHLINPVVFHHLSAGGIRQACPREVGPVAVLALANRLAHAMLLGSSGNDFVYPTADLCQALRIDGATLAGVCETGPTQTLEIKVAMLTQSASGAWKSFRDQVRDRLNVPFRPLFSGAEPALDAYRVFTETLAGPAASDLETPNVGVVHLSSAKDIVVASTRYASAEEAAGCGRIPLIVVSPLAQLNVEPGLAAGRSVVRLPSPLSVHQFVETVNTLLAAERPAPVMQKAA
ncbi:MAG: response regulator [Phycisphaeraceae bacterium]|nr:response regulator [Phycisphaeraceae bacterium]